MGVVEHYGRRGSIGMLQLVYPSFELHDSILKHLGARPALTVRVLAIIRPVGSTAWAAYRAHAIAFLQKGRGSRSEKHLQSGEGVK
jgi:hypothetical protein